MIRSHPAIASGCAWTLIARWSVPGFYAERISSHVGQISPDKDVNCRYTTAAFTLSPESGASSCCADLPGDWALYAVSVRRLIALPEASSRRSLTVPPLPSASIWANGLNTLTGFAHRGLAPHKFTPVPGVHKALQRTRTSRAAELSLILRYLTVVKSNVFEELNPRQYSQCMSEMTGPERWH